MASLSRFAPLVRSRRPSSHRGPHPGSRFWYDWLLVSAWLWASDGGIAPHAKHTRVVLEDPRTNHPEIRPVRSLYKRGCIELSITKIGNVENRGQGVMVWAWEEKTSVPVCRVGIWNKVNRKSEGRQLRYQDIGTPRLPL